MNIPLHHLINMPDAKLLSKQLEVQIKEPDKEGCVNSILKIIDQEEIVTMNDIMERTRYARNTISSALRLLCEDGILECKRNIKMKCNEYWREGYDEID